MRKIKKVEVTDHQEMLDTLASQYVELRGQRDAIIERLGEVSVELEQTMDEAGKTSYTSSSGHKVTVVTRNNDSFNEVTLRKRLGAQMWNKVTTKVLDKRKLDAFIKSGEISPTDVAMSIQQGTPSHYLKVTK